MSWSFGIMRVLYKMLFLPVHMEFEPLFFLNFPALCIPTIITSNVFGTSEKLRFDNEMPIQKKLLVRLAVQCKFLHNKNQILYFLGALPKSLY